MTQLFCNKCGNKSAESEAYSCGCTAVGGSRSPVTTFEITTEVRDKVVMFLTGLHLLGDNSEDLHIVDDLLAQVNDANVSVAGLANEEVAASVLKVLLDAVSDSEKVPVGHKDNYITRPWSLAASNMTSQSYFNECFSHDSKLVECSNPESRCIDYLFSDHFRNLNPEANVDRVNGIQLFEKFFAPVHAQPDAVWIHEGQEYVVEIKTVRNVNSMLKYRKLKDWLYQIAAYQLNTYEDVVNFNTNDTALPADNKKYLLVVILLSTRGSRLIVLEVARDNLLRCSNDWLEWFTNRPKPAADVKDLNKYYTKQTTFAKIKSVAKEAKDKEYKRKEAEAGWTVV